MEIFENETLTVRGEIGSNGEPIVRFIVHDDSGFISLEEASNLVFGLNVWMKVEYTKKLTKISPAYGTFK